MRIQVTLRGPLAGADDAPPEQVEVPDDATVEHLLGELGLASTEVAVALVNGSNAARSTTLHDGDEVTLAGGDQITLAGEV